VFPDTPGSSRGTLLPSRFRRGVPYPRRFAARQTLAAGTGSRRPKVRGIDGTLERCQATRAKGTAVLYGSESEESGKRCPALDSDLQPVRRLIIPSRTLPVLVSQRIMFPPMNFRTFAVYSAILSVTLSSPASAETIPNTTLQPSVWLDASTIELSDGDAVDLWGDISGNARSAFQADAARRPVFIEDGGQGFPVVRFNSILQPGGSANQLMRFDGALANTEDAVLSLYLVSFDPGTRSSATSRATVVNTRDNVNTQKGFLFGYSTEGTLLADYAHVSRTHDAGGNTNLQFTSYAERDLNLFSLTRTGLTSTVETFSDLENFSTTVNWTGFVPSGLNHTQIGTEGGSHYFFGDIAEIIAFEGTALTEEQHLQVVNYLGSKYDIQTIPEPASGLLACAAGIGLLIRRRRR